MYSFGTIIMPPHFQLFMSSGLAKGNFPCYGLRNGDWKWTTKNNNQSKMKRVSRNVEFEIIMFPKLRCFMVALYAAAGFVLKEAFNSRLVTTAV
jgi:hypothetical protein